VHATGWTGHPALRVAMMPKRWSHAMSKKDDYFAKMDSQIKKWDAEVDKLRIRSEQMGTEARAKFAEQLKTMRAARDAAFKKLEELHGSSESAWRHLEAGMDAAWASMKSALEKASAKFKK
jgi:hypothetical protein